uniref:Odorant receptor 24 n=1 Tax=Athetis dissimilis TaxID=1737331 RepID=A0A0S1TS55_ATHDI|nr:odorant receptor 24 [Athetis dissimilis]
MSLVRIIRNFLLKEYFDFDSPDIDMYNFHPQLRMFLAVLGVSFNDKGTWIRFIWPSFCIVLSTVAMVLEALTIWHGVSVKDYSIATECFCYWVILSAIPTVNGGISTNTAKIRDLVKKMNEEFIFVCSLGPKHRKPFLEVQLIIWQLCYAWFTFVCFVSGLYMVLPVAGLTYQSLFATIDENTVRPLQFPVWLPHDDVYRSPNYELLLALELIMVFMFVQSFCGYVYTLFHILLHYYAIMNMIIIDFSVIFEGLDESVALLPVHDKRRRETQHILNARIRRIVTWHRSVFKYVDIIIIYTRKHLKELSSVYLVEIFERHIV